jgi:FAD/FMN-containing dehydrogenase
MPSTLSTTSHQQNTPALELLQLRLPGRVHLPDDEAYEASIASYAYVQTRLSPACIVRPEPAGDVATAVGILGESGVRFAVRGGGHNVNAGYVSEGWYVRSGRADEWTVRKIRFMTW